MFIVASDLGETERERLTSSLSVQGTSDIVYTPEALKTVFSGIVLFAEKLNGESFTQSERTRRQHEQNFHRKNFAEDEFGQWAIDEVTGEQGYTDDERSCFRRWDDNEKTLGSPDRLKVAK